MPRKNMSRRGTRGRRGFYHPWAGRGGRREFGVRQGDGKELKRKGRKVGTFRGIIQKKTGGVAKEGRVSDCPGTWGGQLCAGVSFT